MVFIIDMKMISCCYHQFCVIILWILNFGSCGIIENHPIVNIVPINLISFCKRHPVVRFISGICEDLHGIFDVKNFRITI